MSSTAEADLDLTLDLMAVRLSRIFKRAVTEDAIRKWVSRARIPSTGKKGRKKTYSHNAILAYADSIYSNLTTL